MRERERREGGMLGPGGPGPRGAAPPRTLAGLTVWLGTTFGQRPALVGGEVTLTWAEVEERTRLLALGLRAAGVRTGDRVAVLLPNSVEWVLLDLASARLGAVFVGLNTWYRDEERATVIAHSGARILVTADRVHGADMVGATESLLAACPALERVVTDLSQLESMPEDVTLPEIDPEAAVNILYTSGSTGRPKGVVLHNRHLVENGFAIGERMHLSEDDVLWAAIPFFFSFFSANALVAVMTHGASIVVQERFDAEIAAHLIEHHRCSIFYGMPNMTQSLAAVQSRAQRDLSSLRTGLTIGPPEAIRATAELVPGICSVYGLTETYGNCSVCDSEEPLELRATSQGRLLPGFEAKVVDPESGGRLEPGQVGHMCLRGHVTSGYFDDDAVNRGAFDDEGFLLTGDLCSVDGDSRVRYHGRIKELIKTGGINVSPVDIESALMRHPAVRQAHVVGCPDARDGEVPVAFIERTSEDGGDEDAVREHCRRLLPSYAVPRRFIWITDGDLPRTATGKVVKGELARLL
ncbi:MAG: AMP-binding protein [Candidatus Dormibacteria bacterium]